MKEVQKLINIIKIWRVCAIKECAGKQEDIYPFRI
jgi:hypothetical protein